MVEFYAWSWQARLAVTVLLALCVLAQTLAMVFGFYRRRPLKALPELCVLVLVVFLSLLYGQAVSGFELGLIAPVGFGAWRAGAQSRVFAWVYLALLLALLARAVGVCLLRYKKLRSDVSVFSIKTAIDSLRTGVLFYRPDGFVILSNMRMQRLMTALTGKVARDGRAFYDHLTKEELRPGCRAARFEGQRVCLLPDGAAWMFTRTDLRIRGKTYVQLVAADITERWELTARLQEQNGQLRRRSEELRETIANLHVLSREREAQKAKARAHDIMGQRLTLLLRAVRNEQILDYDTLRRQSLRLLEELKTGQAASTPQDFLDSLRREFSAVGVEISLEGELPEDCAQLFADIVREAVANAVRHGFATEIKIRVEHAGPGCRMRIINNGPPPPGIVTEGGGLGDMRRKLAPYGGTLHVMTRPQFTLEITLPGGGRCA